MDSETKQKILWFSILVGFCLGSVFFSEIFLLVSFFSCVVILGALLVCIINGNYKPSKGAIENIFVLSLLSFLVLFGVLIATSIAFYKKPSTISNEIVSMIQQQRMKWLHIRSIDSMIIMKAFYRVVVCCQFCKSIFSDISVCLF